SSSVRKIRLVLFDLLVYSHLLSLPADGNPEIQSNLLPARRICATIAAICFFISARSHSELAHSELIGMLMNRRTFLTLAAAASLLGLAGCGPASAASSPTPTAQAKAVQSAAKAPPLPSRRQRLDHAEQAAATLPDRLQIPAIDLDIPVVELGWHTATDREGQILSEWDVAEYAAGWHKNSKLPGEVGNVVL